MFIRSMLIGSIAAALLIQGCDSVPQTAGVTSVVDPTMAIPGVAAAKIAGPAVSGLTGASAPAIPGLEGFDIKSLTGDWSLSHLGGQLLSAPAGGGGLPTLSFFEPGRVGGFAGVNRWNSALDQDALMKGDFNLKGVMTTMMAGDSSAMKLEQDFVGALSRTRTFDRAQISKGLLSLLDESGTETLRFMSAGK